ncbi:MAG: pyridoxal-phosphate dependent enzyme, partial [Fulvivirga sp.]
MSERTHIENIEAETTQSGRVKTTLLKFEKRCLYCGRINNSVTYTCDCRSEKWFNEYRVLDIKLFFTPQDKEDIFQSFNTYSFDHADGIAQYKALPFRDWYPRKFEPVGLTPLYYLKNLSNGLNTQIFIKNEGENPSGCFKDRETLLALLNSKRRGLCHAVIYSSGNAAASAAKFAQKLDMQLITFVAGDTYPEKTDFIRRHGSDVIVVGDEKTSFEEGFRIFAAINAEGIFAENGFDNWSVRNPYRVQGDKTTAVEMVKQLGDGPSDAKVPDWVVIPTANGSCIAGIWKGFKEMKQLGIISKLPKMVSV